MKIFDPGVFVILGLFMVLGLSLLWNSNHTYPTRQTQIEAIVDKYKIITIDGECWVLPGDKHLKDIDSAIMHGDYLGQCEMHLKNLE